MPTRSDKATKRRSDEGKVATGVASDCLAEIPQSSQHGGTRNRSGPAPERQPFVAPSLRRSVAFLALFLSPCIISCAQTPPPEHLGELSRLSYPKDTQLGDDLNVVVVRKGEQIELANLTARAFDDVQLWLNQSYVGRVDRLDVGTDNRFTLRHFVNRHGEIYPVGAFLRPDKSLAVVLAELYDPATRRRHRLVVRMGRK